MRWNSEEARQNSLANLRPMDWSKEDPEKVREIKRAGRKGQQESQKRAKDIKSIYAYLLQMDATPDMLGDNQMAKVAQDAAADRGQALSLYEAIALAQAAKAAKGDTGAAVFVRDSAGDKPTDKAEVAGVITEGDAALMEQLQAKFAAVGNNSANPATDDAANTKK